MNVLDARGRALQVGDELLLNLKSPIYFRILGMEAMPSLTIEQAPGARVMVTVMVAIPFQALDDKMNYELIRVRTAEEAGDLPFQLVSGTQPRIVS